jgi:hypothetical protein
MRGDGTCDHPGWHQRIWPDRPQLLPGNAQIAPGFAFYICDERGSLRQHVNIFVEDELIADRARLTDVVKPDSKVYILQALSGG